MVLYVRSRTFCCCIPVRAGVFILSFVGMLGGSFVSALGWIQVSQLYRHPLNTVDQVALYIHTIVFTVLAILSLFGFLGALVKHRNFVSAYAAGLIMFLFISICSGAFALYTIFKQNSQESINTCLNGATDELTMTVCKNGIAMMKGVAVAVYILCWLLIIYAYIIVTNYVDQLDEEISVQETKQMIANISHPAPVITTYDGFAVMGRPGYPFGQANQAYGVRGSHSMV